MSEFSQRLCEVVSPYLALSPDRLALLEAHYDLLARWNRKLNLTAIRTLEEAVTRHYAESLYFGRAVGRLVCERLALDAPGVADVGSGAGFPGIPLAVLHPGWPVTLIESHQRKAVFLAESSRAVHNVTVFSGRAEAIGERFDLVVSRAVDPQAVLGLGLAPVVALLAGEADVPRGTIVEKLPWGDRRVISWQDSYLGPSR